MATPVFFHEHRSYIVNRSVSIPSIEFVKHCSLTEIEQHLTSLTKNEISEWVNSKDDKGKTALAIAIEAHSPANNRLEIIKFLVLKCSADPNLSDNDLWTPLYRASNGTCFDVLEFLLKQGAIPDAANNDGSTPLHRCADRGADKELETLLKSGANKDAINCFGTPLAYAAKNGNCHIAGLILKEGADPNLVDDPLAFTPLKLAVNNQKDEMQKLLESWGAKIEAPQDSKVHTHLSRLIFSENENAIMESFNRNEKDSYERTMAHYCAHHGLKLLQDMKPVDKIDIKDIKGRTPLHYAIIQGHQDLIDYLINEGCDLETQDHQGYTSLMLACQYNRVPAALALLKKAKEQGKTNSLLNKQDKFGWKPIHKAAQVGNVDLVQLFIEVYHVNFLEPTINGRLPEDLARTTSATKVLDYFAKLRSSLLDNFNKV